MTDESHLTNLKRRAAARGRPKRKVGLVRWLWPQIRDALEHGYSVLEVHSGLREAGIRLHYQNLTRYIRLLRREDSDSAGTVGNISVINPFVPQHASAPLNDMHVGRNQKPHDPLANYRERESKRPTFEYRPPLPGDEDKLI